MQADCGGTPGAPCCEGLQVMRGKARRCIVTAAACALALCLAGPAASQPAEAGQPLRLLKFADLGSEAVSPDVRHVADWAVHSGDPAGAPFVVVDKVNGRLFVFDSEGRLRGAAPALVGSAKGDHSVPGIGDRPLSSIRPDERTTPAGRFVARMGTGPRGEDVLWVDYEGAVAIHRVVTGVPKERRLQRLESKVALDRRITYGCINVPVKFYESVVAPMFKASGGVVYVLPETRPVQDVFRSYEVRNDVPAGEPVLVPVTR
jgi:hypothetical protein